MKKYRELKGGIVEAPSFSTLRIECERREFEVRRQAVVDKILSAEVEREENK